MSNPCFTTAIRNVSLLMRKAKTIQPNNWQSIDVSKRPEALMMECCNVFFKVDMRGTDLQYYRDQIQPNLPWADRHFELERVSGQPINPGTTWKEWPGGNSAEKFLENGIFSHTYAERYWPKSTEALGIRYRYGDLQDVVRLLARDLHTRQAFLPVWFPEDTGVVHGKRVPCTLGYHFMVRQGKLGVFYPIRSCDFANHLRDDLYLTVRLVLWIIDQLKPFHTLEPGIFSFWCGSLHMFINNWNAMYGKDRTR